MTRKIYIWPGKTGTTKCAFCSAPMNVATNAPYLFEGDKPVHDRHGSPEELRLLKAERYDRERSDAGKLSDAGRRGWKAI